MVKNEKKQLAKKIREFTSNRRLINLNVKDQKESIQKSTSALFKETGTVFNALRTRTISIPPKT